MKFYLLDDVSFPSEINSAQEALSILFERTIQMERWQDQLAQFSISPKGKQKKMMKQYADAVGDLFEGIRFESQLIFKELYPKITYRPHLEQYVLTLQQTLEMMNKVFRSKSS